MFPPLNPLRVFSVAARLGSFTRAAEELNISQSAVSRQVAVLEGYFGVQLFARERDGVLLTGIAEKYYKEIAPAFLAIEKATNRLTQDKLNMPLRIRVYTTFAAKWLLGRLVHFQELYPNIELQLSHSVKPVDFMRDPVELAIQFGNGAWSGSNCEFLVPDLIQPVCSPRLLKAAAKLKKIEDLRNYRLLHARYRRSDWSDWLRGVGSEIDIREERRTVFDSSMTVYQAAIEGFGIAIGQVKLLDAEFASGTLVPLFRPIQRPLGYYAVWPNDRTLGKNLSIFLAWLRKMAE